MKKESDYPGAMPAPADPLTILNRGMVSDGTSASRESPRRRIIQPLHRCDGDILQRMLNIVQPGSYIRPHRHEPERGESIVLLSGSILYVTFTEDGSVDQSIRLEAGADRFGIDIVGGIWHSFAALEPDTVLFEVKPGPYNARTDKTFAPWAPEEGSGQASAYLAELLRQYATTSS